MFIKLTRGEMPTEHGLRDDVGRFGVADDAQGFKSAVCERGFEFMIQSVAGDSICDHEDGVAGESRLSAGNGVRNCGSCRGMRCDDMIRKESHIQLFQMLEDAILFKGELSPIRN